MIYSAKRQNHSFLVLCARFSSAYLTEPWYLPGILGQTFNLACLGIPIAHIERYHGMAFLHRALLLFRGPNHLNIAHGSTIGGQQSCDASVGHVSNCPVTSYKL